MPQTTVDGVGSDFNYFGNAFYIWGRERGRWNGFVWSVPKIFSTKKLFIDLTMFIIT